MGLREALRSKDGPMKVATTRFAVRAKRPNVEQTRDYVHGGLLSEINDISGSQEALKQQIASAEETLHRLLKNKERLQQDMLSRRRVSRLMNSSVSDSGKLSLGED